LLITVDGDREQEEEELYLEETGAAGRRLGAPDFNYLLDLVGMGDDNATSAPTPNSTTTAPTSAPEGDKNIDPAPTDSPTVGSIMVNGSFSNTWQGMVSSITGMFGGNGNDQGAASNSSVIPTTGAPTTPPTIMPTKDEGNIMATISNSLQNMVNNVTGVIGANGDDQGEESEKCLGDDKCGSDKCMGGDKCGNTTIIILVAEDLVAPQEKSLESASNGSSAPAKAPTPAPTAAKSNATASNSSILDNMLSGIQGILGLDKDGEAANTSSPTLAPPVANTSSPTVAPVANTSSPTVAPVANTSSPTVAPDPTTAPTGPPSTAAPSACDVCKEAPKISNVPPAKTICPGEYDLPMGTEIGATDVCLHDLMNTNGTATSDVTVSQQENFINNNTCAGTVVNTWSVQLETCNGSAPVTATQTLTIQDIEAPKFVDVVLPDAVFTCPEDFNETQLVPPFASDNCDANVNVQPQTASLQECNELKVTWIATDECGNEATLSQTVKIDDSTAPILTSDTPYNATISCASELPPATTLTFEDNCAGDFIVNATEVNLGGSFCVGNVTKRTWEGPSDLCGNTAKSITQTFTVMDLAPPVLPSELEPVILMCPKEFKLNELMAPNATDDCSAPEAISVQATALAPTKCEDVVVTWTAKDECGNVFTSNQLVGLPPIRCHLAPLTLQSR
jgi:hypothetical protein